MVNGKSSDTDIEAAEELERLRAENAPPHDQLETAPKKGAGQQRRFGSVICAVVGAIILPLSVLTVWTRQTILDTDQYVQTVAPLAENEDIQEAVTFQVTELVAEAVDFQTLAEQAFPERAILAGALEFGAKSLITQVVSQLVKSDQFANVWESANRIGHENVVKVLTGSGNDVVETAGGRIVLKLGPVANLAIAELDGRLGTNFAERFPVDELNQEFVIVESDDLSSVQSALGLLDSLSWITVILTTVLLIGAVLLAENRRLGFRRVGIAIVAPMIIALVLYSWGRGQYNDSLSASVRNPGAATAFFDTTTRFVLRSFRTLLVLGATFLIGSWVVGPSATAARIRAWWNQLLGRAGDAGSRHDVGAVPRWVATQQNTLTIATVSVAVIALVLWTRPTGLVLLLLIAAALVIIGIIRLVAEVGRRADLESAEAAVGVAARKNAVINEVEGDVAEETLR
ncbi:hypothetical protein K0U83_14195 [bacterium]|nr:hypothetical protein [bacterium]